MCKHLVSLFNEREADRLSFLKECYVSFCEHHHRVQRMEKEATTGRMEKMEGNVTDKGKSNTSRTGGRNQAEEREQEK